MIAGEEGGFLVHGSWSLTHSRSDSMWMPSSCKQILFPILELRCESCANVFVARDHTEEEILRRYCGDVTFSHHAIAIGILSRVTVLPLAEDVHAVLNHSLNEYYCESFEAHTLPI